MNKISIENAIIVKNRTRLEQLIQRFNTQSQAKFYINQSQDNFYKKNKSSVTKKKVSLVPEAIKLEDYTESGAKEATTEIQASRVGSGEFEEYEDEHERFHKSLESIQKQLSGLIKTKILEHEFLPNYLFTPRDLVIVIGQDGLVANTAKYVSDIPVIAVNPDPERFDGVLLPFNTDTFLAAVQNVLSGKYQYNNVTMAEAKLSDGQRLLAFNDFFIGPTSHISARYKITYNNHSENHSSSGIIVSTGAGSTGWLSSLFNMANGINKYFGANVKVNPRKMRWNTNELVFIVREPFLSKTSQVDLSAGIITRANPLILESYMPRNGVIFSDGIQSDFLQFNSGAITTIGVAKEKAVLVK